MSYAEPYKPGSTITDAVLQRMESDVALDAAGAHDASPHYWITRGELRAMLVDLIAEVRHLSKKL